LTLIGISAHDTSTELTTVYEASEVFFEENRALFDFAQCGLIFHLMAFVDRALQIRYLRILMQQCYSVEMGHLSILDKPTY
jgi:hypothetical protein